MWVSVPVTLVRRSAQANTRNDNGIRIAAKNSSAAIGQSLPFSDREIRHNQRNLRAMNEWLT
jgi:hypothetical protein